MQSYPLAKHFEDAANQIKTHGKSMNNNDLQVIYGLYKQATVGDINIEKPSFYQLEAKAKYAAWESNKGKSQDQAKHEYVEYCLKFFPEDLKKTYV
jgi:diazepam-binding inhibitor (GABA receptor modulating acyl-CoA-binding protein)